ncbi:hypothetical protein [Phenylobacterium sp.]|jgi:hypothetical protein|uniref:hypothetical protein n=1 Tax=Phenylobacterium sp. TaxID=1871053 RepID=UPI002F948286
MSFVFGPDRKPPAGWRVSHDGELVEDRSVAGYVARGREVKGLCQLRDCRRRCHLDLERLAERGLGALSIGELKPLYRCHRLDGCGLDFSEQYGAELTLGMLAGRDHVGVRVACGGCRKSTVVRPEQVIERLKLEGRGGSDTPVATLADLARQPCPKCQARRWTVAVLWLDPAQTPSWLRDRGNRPAG